MFLACPFPLDLVAILQSIIAKTDVPLAVRSSSVLEDSISNPFAGVFRTYLIPNSHANA